MKTKIQITLKAYQELKISGITSSADNEDIVLALETLEDFMSSFPIDLGYNFESPANPNSPSGLQPYAIDAIQLALAVELCAAFGKSPDPLITRAQAKMSALYSRVSNPGRVAYPSRQPLGMGNRGVYPGHSFMGARSSAPKNINTEQFTLNDSRVISVDLSGQLSANESILSYTKSPSSGILISNENLFGKKLIFTVKASQSGYQYIDFAFTGTLGTIVNRRLDFNVSEVISIQGNP